MSEIARLECQMEHGGMVTLILSQTTLILEPDSEFRERTLGNIQKGMEQGGEAPGVIGWIVRTALGYATDVMEKLFAPHPIDEVQLHLTHDHLSVKLDKFKNMNMNGLKVNPTDAFIFEAKFRQAREALGK